APGLTFTVHLNNPTAFPETLMLPRLFKAAYASDRGHRTALLIHLEAPDTPFTVQPMTRHTVTVQLTEPLDSSPGFVSLRLIEPESNPIMFELHSFARDDESDRPAADSPHHEPAQTAPP